MTKFLSEIIEWKQFELVIDKDIYSKDIVLKAAYNLLDKGYFFFSLDGDKNIVLQFTSREWVKDSPQNVMWEFADNLLDTYLRDKLEKDNKVIRETIVEKAINWPLDYSNFVSLDTDNSNNSEQNQIDFDKDIDDILKEIENDPELKIDEEEIENILKEIEEETSSEDFKPKITVNKDAISWAKDMFKNKDK